MAKILPLIPKQNFEYIGPRLAEILREELDYQNDINYGNDDLEGITICVERHTPINHTEAKLINISMATGRFDNKHMANVDGSYTWWIDVYTNSKTTPDAKGDLNAANLNQRIFGVVKAILTNPVYKTLGFVPGWIGRIGFETLNIAEPKEGDSRNNYMTRLAFTALLGEVTSKQEPVLAEGFDTRLKISLSEEGYYWVTEIYNG